MNGIETLHNEEDNATEPLQDEKNPREKIDQCIWRRLAEINNSSPYSVLGPRSDCKNKRLLLVSLIAQLLPTQILQHHHTGILAVFYFYCFDLVQSLEYYLHISFWSYWS